MAVDLWMNKDALFKAYHDVTDAKTDTDWALFGYDELTYVLKVIGTGNGGITQMAASLNRSKIMYAFCRVHDPNTELAKFVLINWQGEEASAAVKMKCAVHQGDIQGFLKGTHVTFTARAFDDIDVDEITKLVAKSSGANYSFHTEQPKKMDVSVHLNKIEKKLEHQTKPLKNISLLGTEEKSFKADDQGSKLQKKEFGTHAAQRQSFGFYDSKGYTRHGATGLFDGRRSATSLYDEYGGTYSYDRRRSATSVYGEFDATHRHTKTYPYKSTVSPVSRGHTTNEREQKSKKNDKLIVAAIDFGTTYSGWAFSFMHEYKLDPTRVSTQHWHAGGAGALVSEKAPTCILIEPDGKTLSAFGYDAENKYIQLLEEKKHQSYYYFERFKMMLNVKLEKGLPRSMKLQDVSGKSLDAKVVFSLAIRFLKDNMVNVCKKRLAQHSFTESDVQWVLTVPAIWSDAAKQFMREAAIDAGIDSKSLKLAFEPEAASIFCRHLPVEKTTDETSGNSVAGFMPGTKYMVLDAGGGTVDIVVHEVKPSGRLKQVYRSTGGAWGGTVVDENFKQMIINIFGDCVYQQFKNEHTEDWLELFRDFEIKKRNITSNTDNKITFKLPLALVELFKSKTGKTVQDAIQATCYAGKITQFKDKMRFDPSVMQRLFAVPIDSIIRHIKTLMKEPCVCDISAILMVGGFSECKMLQDAIQKEFPFLKPIIPMGAGLCVLKGAVIFGHNPKCVDERVLQYTYGFKVWRHFKRGQDPESKKITVEGKKKCRDVFDKYVTINDTVQLGEIHRKKTYFPATGTSTASKIVVFATEKEDPVFVTDAGCIEIGRLVVDMPDTTDGLDRPVQVSLLFDDTEIQVDAIEEKTGKLTTASFDFLIDD